MAGRHSRPFSTKPGHSASSRRVETKTERGLVPLSRAQTAPGGSGSKATSDPSVTNANSVTTGQPELYNATGSNGANAGTATEGASPGLGASNWSTKTTLPAAAGAAAAAAEIGSAGDGGNAGLVILSYFYPGTTCPL